MSGPSANEPPVRSEISHLFGGIRLVDVSFPIDHISIKYALKKAMGIIIPET